MSKPTYRRPAKNWSKRFSNIDPQLLTISCRQLENGWTKIVKTIDGRTITLTFDPVQLDSHTKEGSIQAAKKWVDEISAQLTITQEQRKQERINELQKELARLQIELDGNWSENIDGIDQTIGEIDDIRSEIKIRQVAAQQKIDIDATLKTAREASQLIGDDAPIHLQAEIYAPQLAAAKVINVNDTIGYWQQRYLEKTKVEKSLSPGGWANLASFLQTFVDYMGANRKCSDIDADLWEQFTIHLTTSHTKSRCRESLRVSRSFIDYLYKFDQLTLPKNLNDSKPKKAALKQIEHFTPEELTELLATTTGHLKCFVYIMVNCGFTQIDVGTLTPAMIQGDYLVRHRSKTKDGDDLPDVKWRLWTTTKDLIAQYRTDIDGLLFTDENNRTWYKNELRADGKLSKDDKISGLFVKYRKNHPTRLSLKHIRKSSAQYIKGKDSLKDHFLNHMPKKTGPRHYYKTPQAKLDAAILALGVLLEPKADE